MVYLLGKFFEYNLNIFTFVVESWRLPVALT